MLAPTGEYLDTRLALVEAGDLAEARRMWAERSLIPAPPPDLIAQESHWWNRLGGAVDRLARGGRDGQAYYRLARVLQDVRWHREALAMARRSLMLDPELESARELEETLANLDQFTTEVDSLIQNVFAREIGGQPGHRELPRTTATLAGSHGFTNDSIMRRGLYFGRRPPIAPSSTWSVELSVMVDHRGPVTIERPDGAIRVRRVVVDDDRFPTPPGAEPPIWELEPGLVWRDEELGVYHHRNAHRRAGMALYLALERRAGAAPATLAALGDGMMAAPLAPPRPGREDGDAGADKQPAPDDTGNTSSAAPQGGDWLERIDGCRLAEALRLQATAPLFNFARAQAHDRYESRRRFIVQLMKLRMEQVEQRMARNHLDQMRAGIRRGPQRQEEWLFLDGLNHAPLPHWQLAELFDAACRPEARDARAIAARATLRYLRRTAEIVTTDDWLRLDEQALREAARRIAADRYGDH